MESLGTTINGKGEVIVRVVKNDGGRAAAGYKGQARDCVIRAIAIATEQPYEKVYNDLFDLNRKNLKEEPGLVRMGKKASPRNGNTPMVNVKKYLYSFGWKWVPTMKIGSGCKVHLRNDELPSGRIICRVSKHFCAMIDGVIHDTFDPSRCGERCVYGYFISPSPSQHGN